MMIKCGTIQLHSEMNTQPPLLCSTHTHKQLWAQPDHARNKHTLCTCKHTHTHTHTNTHTHTHHLLLHLNSLLALLHVHAHHPAHRFSKNTPLPFLSLRQAQGSVTPHLPPSDIQQLLPSTHVNLCFQLLLSAKLLRTVEIKMWHCPSRTCSSLHRMVQIYRD